MAPALRFPVRGIAMNNSLGEPELNPRGFLRGSIGERLPSNMAPTLAWDERGSTLAVWLARRIANYDGTFTILDPVRLERKTD